MRLVNSMTIHNYIREHISACCEGRKYSETRRGIGQMSYNDALKQTWIHYNIISQIVAIHQWDVVHNGLHLSSGRLSRLRKTWKVSGMTELAKRPCITLECDLQTTKELMHSWNMFFLEPHQFLRLYWIYLPQKETQLKPYNPQWVSELTCRDTTEVGDRTSLEESTYS